MANRKILLTYLWTDPSIMLDDFTRKISEKMTDWANTFYAKYGFELDVEPKPLARKSVNGASKYILTRGQGVMPDMRDYAEVFQEDEARIAELDKQIAASLKDQEKLKERVEEAEKRVDRLRNERDQIEAAWTAATDPVLRQQLKTRLDAAEAALKQARGVYDRRSDESTAGHRATTALLDRSLALYRKIRIRGMEISGEYELRHQMALRWKQDKVGDGKRVNVVFCKMSGWLSMRNPGTVGGNTFSPLSDPIVSIRDLVFLWPYHFIVIDLAAPTRSVAHEVVHAAGQLHPGPMTVYTSLEKRPVRMTFPKGSLMGAPFSDLDIKIPALPFKKVGGGFYDGAANDLMNYTLDKDLGPEACILNDSDKKRLDDEKTFITP